MYSGKNILIAGGQGLIGKQLSKLLIDKGAIVKVVDKKINNGQDEQGRLYVHKTNSEPTRFVILVGHKQDQKSDIEYLRKNDPPEGWDK